MASAMSSYVNPVHKAAAQIWDRATAQTEYLRDMVEIEIAHFLGSEVERAYLRLGKLFLGDLKVHEI